MGIGTLLSRLTGLVRLIVTAVVLGIGSLADVFNLANTMPNIVHDLVLDGVLSATFVPVFVERLSKHSEEEASESISAVLTISTVVLVGATLAFCALAPLISMIYFGGSSSQRSLATWLLLLFAPQLLGYGSISLMTAVLNSRRRFAAPMFVPILNNLVCIVVLAEFAVLAHNRSVGAVGSSATLVLLLGGGTTLGVIVQAIALVPSARRCGLHLRPVWKPHDPAVRRIMSLSGWTFGFVIANQVALAVVLALASRLGHGPVSEYTYAFTFFQLPFGIVAVSVMTAVTPDLAARFGAHDFAGMRERLSAGTRQILGLVVPAAVGYLVLAPSVLTLLLRHGAAASSEVSTTAAVLALLSLGLPGYCMYLLAIRAFQAMQDTRTAFFLYVLENGINIVAAIVFFKLDRGLGARGLALSLSIAYTVAAIAAYAVLRRRLGGLDGRRTWRAAVRVLGLSLLMAVVTAVLDVVVGSGSGIGLLVRVVVSVGGGIAAYLGGAGLAGSAGAWQTARKRQRRHWEGHVRGPRRY
jgi:putative peptidoglycan lipid II flippase